jgi:hypothetical protein
MKKIFFALFILLSLKAFSQSMKPGLWKTTTAFKLNGIPLPTKDSDGCVSAKEAKDAKKTITDGLKKDGCELTKWEIQSGNLQASLSCKNKDIEAKGDLHGKFTEKHYELEGDATGTYMNAIPSAATVRLTGTWVKSCKK